MFQLVSLNAFPRHKRSICSAKVNEGRSRTAHFDHAVFSRNFGVIEHDIRAGPAQYASSFSQTKYLPSRRPLDDRKRHGLVCG